MLGRCDLLLNILLTSETLLTTSQPSEQSTWFALVDSPRLESSRVLRGHAYAVGRAGCNAESG